MAKTAARSATSDPGTAEIRAFRDSKAWQAWLEKNHQTSTGLWLRLAKKGSGTPTVTYGEDGQWEAAYDSPGSATVPADLERELKKSPRAREFFKTLNAANRYAILWRLQTAKKAETRTKRMRSFIEMLEKGDTIH